MSSIKVKSQSDTHFAVHWTSGHGDADDTHQGKKLTITGWAPKPRSRELHEDRVSIEFDVHDTFIVKGAKPAARPSEIEKAFVIEVIRIDDILKGGIFSITGKGPQCNAEICDINGGTKEIRLTNKGLETHLNAINAPGFGQKRGPPNSAHPEPYGLLVVKNDATELNYRWIEKRGDDNINHIICGGDNIRMIDLQRWTQIGIEMNQIGPIGGLPRSITPQFNTWGFAFAHKEFDNILIANDDYKKSDAKYQVIKIPTNVNDGYDNNDMIVITLIFITLSVLCAIVCFIMGSGVGATYCYSFAKRKVNNNKYSFVNDDTELV